MLQRRDVRNVRRRDVIRVETWRRPVRGDVRVSKQGRLRFPDHRPALGQNIY